ncbi:MAG: hypothetical protein JWO05_450 [Gemmatimonadetes bacterium]|nr:hypothetical protein [Gemmatimonadota bacterium]
MLPRFVILAEGAFSPSTSKTANACIRYRPERVVAVLDSTQAGRTAQEVLGFGGPIPVVATLDEAIAFGPEALLIGIAPAGGQLPGEWHSLLLHALDRGLDLWSGLHTMLGDDAALASRAATNGRRINDLRRAPANLDVSRGRLQHVRATVVLTVGTDCNIGKMTTQLQLLHGLRALGHRVAFAATGQTGILVEGRGVAVDAVIADFIAGAAEQLVLDCAEDADIVLVEGQGSIIHPSYSGVTYGLIHGSLPHAQLLCVQPTRETVTHHDWVRIPPLAEFVRMSEAAAAPLRPAPVIGIAVNTWDMNERDARDAVARAAAETGLPAADPVRDDPAPLVQAIHAFHVARATA